MSQSLVRGALTDENGQWDVAYVSLFALMLAVVGPIMVMTGMGMVAHFRCSPHEVIVKEVLTVIACTYDPQPLGIAIGSACGGFGVALGALAAYMAATRRPPATTNIIQAAAPAPSGTTNIVQASAPAPAVAQPQTDPLKVAVVDMPPDEKRAARTKK